MNKIFILLTKLVKEATGCIGASGVVFHLYLHCSNYAFQELWVWFCTHMPASETGARCLVVKPNTSIEASTSFEVLLRCHFFTACQIGQMEHALILPILHFDCFCRPTVTHLFSVEWRDGKVGKVCFFSYFHIFGSVAKNEKMFFVRNCQKLMTFRITTGWMAN